MHWEIILSNKREANAVVNMPELLAHHATRNMMRAIAILVTVVGLLVSGLSVPLRAEPGSMGGPCAEIRAACLGAGFVPNGARSGIGIAVDCVQPIMVGTPQREQATKPLPPLDPQVVAACKARNPNFGFDRGQSLFALRIH